jgi:hypothetical protein
MATDPTAVDAIAIALRVAAAIESCGGAYFVGGSLASSLQGEPRATNDIDIVLQLPILRIEPFVAALGTDSKSTKTCFATHSTTDEAATFSICRPS